MEQLISALPKLTSLCLTNCAMTDALLATFGAALLGPRKQPLVGLGISGNPNLSVEAWSAFLSQLPASVTNYVHFNSKLVRIYLLSNLTFFLKK